MPDALTYASPPPPDRVEVVWQGDELDITVPARPTPRAIMTMTVLVAATLVLWLLAIRGSLGIPGGGAIRIVGDIAGRVLALIFGVFSFAWALTLLRQCRTWSSITLRSIYLIVRAPGVPGVRASHTRRVRFDTLTDVTVGRVTSKRDKGTYLLLHRASGPPEPVLENLTHRVGDLRIVAAALREAIARRKLSA
jgi:hypothetical protein